MGGKFVVEESTTHAKCYSIGATSRSRKPYNLSPSNQNTGVCSAGNPVGNKVSTVAVVETVNTFDDLVMNEQNDW